MKRGHGELRKWWEVHLDPHQGWLTGDQQGDFGRVISGTPRLPTAVVTVREFDDGEANIVWRAENIDAARDALKRHPLMLSGNPAPLL